MPTCCYLCLEFTICTMDHPFQYWYCCIVLMVVTNLIQDLVQVSFIINLSIHILGNQICLLLLVLSLGHNHKLDIVFMVVKWRVIIHMANWLTFGCAHACACCALFDNSTMSFVMHSESKDKFSIQILIDISTLWSSHSSGGEFSP